MRKCRLCLTEEQLYDVTDLREGLSISVIVMIICPVKILSNDALPKFICNFCLDVVLGMN